MFSKKKCQRCGEKLNKNYSYCPTCGASTQNEYYNDEADWGVLGKNDDMGFEDAEIRLPFGFNALFNSLVKSLDKQFREIDKQLGREQNNRIQKDKLAKSGGIRINISSGTGKPPKIIVRSFGNLPEFREQERQIKKQIGEVSSASHENFSEKNVKKLSQLPRKEPKTNIKRLSDKVIYEIDLPGVKSEKDISIIQLENSIEIKAIGKKEAYFKLIPINLPIKTHKLNNGKLVLELETKD